MFARAANTYRRVSLQSASPIRLLDELYGRFLLDCQRARDAITMNDVRARGEAISHALAIVGELRAALDAQQAPDLFHNLHRLYGWVADRLTAANVAHEAAPLVDAESTVQTLREAFRQAGGL